jgi:DNA-binding transcriptional ArsR family regulator
VPTDRPRQLETLHVSDPEMLRALAHPLRQRLLLALVTRGHGRAADLADVVDAPANSISFHLRALAKAGLIVEAPDLARDRRDRVWRAVAEKFQVEAEGPGADAVGKPILRWLQALFARDAERLVGGADDVHRVSAGPLILSRSEASALGDELQEVVDRWAERSRDGGRDEPDEERPDEGRTFYQVVFAVAPQLKP